MAAISVRSLLLCSSLRIGPVLANKLHASVAFTRAGERVPSLEPGSSGELTSLGAQQLYATGDFFRHRYLIATSENETDVLSSNHIDGLSKNTLDSNQLLVMTPESQHTVASAQAFLQGLYPPYRLDNATFAGVLDHKSAAGNGTYIESPLEGYQYAQVRTYSASEPHIVYLAGEENCPTYQTSVVRYKRSAEFKKIQQETVDFYESLKIAAMEPDVANEAHLDYYDAYEIYEYLSYRYQHDKGTENLLSANDTSLSGYFARAGWYAAQQQWALNSDDVTPRSINTIAGQTLAAEILGIFQQHITGKGSGNKLNLLFGDLEPFLAFASLASIDAFSPQFKNLPEHGSSMVFELYSSGTENTTAFPSEDELWVEFFFRNGSSDIGYNLQAYPIFHRGPSTISMKWKEFKTSVRSIMTSDVGVWCETCQAESTFCAAFNPMHFSRNAPWVRMSPEIAGVIGAFVTLSLLGLVAITAHLFGGIRLSKHSGGRSSRLGGYKGSAKMASDVDLIIPKAAVIAGQTSGRERVGSWELKKNDMGPGVSTDEAKWDEDEEEAVSPYAKSVQPRLSL